MKKKQSTQKSFKTWQPGKRSTQLCTDAQHVIRLLAFYTEHQCVLLLFQELQREANLLASGKTLWWTHPLNFANTIIFGSHLTCFVEEAGHLPTGLKIEKAT